MLCYVCAFCVVCVFFFFQAEDGIRDFCLSRGLGDVYKRQGINAEYMGSLAKPEFEVQSKSQLNSPKQNDIDSEFFMEELPFVKVIPLEQELQQEKKKSLFAHL
eukprot:TRINITY_DN9859_c0_g1_i2.p1 TRINITY_DN9859_c0_g1~~TRINITY_DN9859_c0_g1_i2.p1  ORF type:complete len:104 (-),score=30.57 TRINITY_DN9859_c0_g1_i2:54-365(-)